MSIQKPITDFGKKLRAAHTQFSVNRTRLRGEARFVYPLPLQDKELMAKPANREERLDVVAEAFDEAGYEVRRVPNLIVDDRPIVNYTNVIFSGRDMTFPVNGVRGVDAQMERVFMEMGYTTHPMKVVQKSFLNKGGIRCLLETYRRNRVTLPNASARLQPRK